MTVNSSTMRPAANDANLSNVHTAIYSCVPLPAGRRREGVLPTIGGLPALRNDIVGHQVEDTCQIVCRSRLQPGRDQQPNRLFVGIHDHSDCRLQIAN